MGRKRVSLLFGALLLMFVTNPVHAAGDWDTDLPVIPHLPPTPTFSATAVPANGDLNPYGVAFVPFDFPAGGSLHPGDILVSNFNNSSNLQGSGGSDGASAGCRE
jgi:hypothetical protein